MISKITPDHVRNPEAATFSYIEKAIPFLGGRPDRNVNINTDDIVNLIIACNTCGSLEDFFAVT